ncbi:MAG: GNAT family N-acetyltransferase [Anaerolineales bacterium]|nr:GNAT family N-acetyltransferase [Anaerolineales bacterium]
MNRDTLSLSVSLLPLDATVHATALQAVYAATPAYWGLYNLPGAAPDQAIRDLQAAQETPGRFLMGIVQRIDPGNAEAGAELIGMIDFRLQWPAEKTVYIGMIMVAEPRQRQGVATQAWQLLRRWLAEGAQMQTARVGIEQFNPTGLQFWLKQGFTLTGESNRTRVGDKFVRTLYLEDRL